MKIDKKLNNISNTHSIMTSYIYICGRGYSGSTMLDAMLGNAPEIESVGELVSGIKRYDELCSCSETYEKCGFWRNVRDKFAHENTQSWDAAAGQLIKQAHLKKLPTTLFLSSSSKWARTRLGANLGVFSAIKEVSSKQLILDSSKEVTRAFFLIKNLPDVKVIHLVKSPITVLESTYYRLESGAGFRFLRRQFTPKRIFWPALSVAALGWLVGNLLAEFVRLYDKNRVFLVRYEDIANNPVETFERLEKYLDVDLTDIKQKILNGGEFEIGHNIGGNHMRHAQKFVFDPRKQSRGGLPQRYAKLVKLVCYPLMKKYGYIT